MKWAYMTLAYINVACCSINIYRGRFDVMLLNVVAFILCSLVAIYI